MKKTLISENKTYQNILPELSKTDLGKFVLIKESELIGVYQTKKEALDAGYDKFNDELFLVREILKVKEPMDFRKKFSII
jgi:hypothetical protein